MSDGVSVPREDLKAKLEAIYSLVSYRPSLYPLGSVRLAMIEALCVGELSAESQQTIAKFPVLYDQILIFRTLVKDGRDKFQSQTFDPELWFGLAERFIEKLLTAIQDIDFQVALATKTSTTVPQQVRSTNASDANPSA